LQTAGVQPPGADEAQAEELFAGTSAPGIAEEEQAHRRGLGGAEARVEAGRRLTRRGVDPEDDDRCEKERPTRNEDQVDAEGRSAHPQPRARRRPERKRAGFERPLVGCACVTPRRDALAFLRRFASAPKVELHLHLEGAVPAAALVRLSSRSVRPIFPDVASVRARRHALGSKEEFFGFYRDVCRQLRSPADYALVARGLVSRLVRENVRWAEVTVSPAVVEKIGLDWFDVQEALERVFERHEARGRGRVRVLLDFVRHWGPAAAERVLDLHAERPWPRAVGFGLGGDETAFAARDFADVYRRGRKAGLLPVVHAGEWAGPESVADALRFLRPVRIAHGIRAVEDPLLLKELARRGVVCDVCPTSNLRTGAVSRGAEHPLRRLLAAGVPVTLSTDDPGLFGTTLAGEYRRAASWGATGAELARCAADARQAAARTRSYSARYRDTIGPASKRRVARSREARDITP
jgi:adenosine deaminase